MEHIKMILFQHIQRRTEEYANPYKYTKLLLN